MKKFILAFLAQFSAVSNLEKRSESAIEAFKKPIRDLQFINSQIDTEVVEKNRKLALAYEKISNLHSDITLLDKSKSNNNRMINKINFIFE